MNPPVLTEEPLSDYLQRLVAETRIGHEVALEINRLHSEDLQRRAVERYLENRIVLAQQIVRDLLVEPIVQAPGEDLPAVALSADLPVEPEALSPEEVWAEFWSFGKSLRLVLVLGLLGLVVIGVWWGNRVFQKPVQGSTPDLPPISRPVGVPAAARRVDRIVSASSPRTIAQASRSVTEALRSPQVLRPTGFVSELIRERSVVLRWNPVESDSRYNLYWATSRDPALYQKDPGSPFPHASTIWRAPGEDKTFFFKLTTLNVENQESALFTSLRVDLE